MNAFVKATEVEKEGRPLAERAMRYWGMSDVDWFDSSSRRDRHLQVHGKVDCVCRWARDVVAIDAKNELKFTGRLFLETWSNKSRGRHGWLVDGHSDYVVYTFSRAGRAYLFDRRQVVERVKYLLAQRPGMYLHVKQRKYDQLNDTWGLLVPTYDIIGMHYPSNAPNGKCGFYSERAGNC